MSVPFTSLGLGAIATFTVFTGSKIGLTKQSYDESDSSANPDDAALDLTWAHIAVFPLTSSLMLLLLFYFFEYFQYVLLALIGTSILFICYHTSSSLALYARPSMQRSTLLHIVCIGVTIALVCGWLGSSIICFDIISCLMSVHMIAHIRFPSLKLASICFLLLTVYDIYWVFISEQHFSENVMVSVATKKSTNPIHALGEHMGIEGLKNMPIHLELPMKIMLPAATRMMMLGLGDIVIPGMLVALALKCDSIRNGSSTANDDVNTRINAEENGVTSLHPATESKPKAHSYRQHTYLFETCIIAYAVGLLVAFSAGYVSQAPQPALLYLCPIVGAAFAGRAATAGRLMEVWQGPKTEEAKS
jgi:signal peptide peptidase-like protein 3